MIEYPIIPETIVVHLGAPTTEAQNVSLSFSDYIKNVASSEIYPTWPREAIEANILAQISVALNRVYTGFYRVAGRDFDITSSPAYDQTFIFQRNIFSNISEIVDEIFNSYIKRRGFIEPLFATFCDGVEVKCNGLEQWGSVSLANEGRNAEEILKYYYGDDIEIVKNVEIANYPSSAPLIPLGEGDTGRDVELLQLRLNRISANFPGIPKIYPINGFFGDNMTAAVKKFQEVFNLTVDGIVGRATWNRIQNVYNAVKKLQTVNSEGLKLSDLSTQYPGELSMGMTSSAVLTLQYYLYYISSFVPTVLSISVDGAFGYETKSSVESYQRTYGLPANGIVDRLTWDYIQNSYYSFLESLDYRFSEGVLLPFPGRLITPGVSGEDVLALQKYLNYIAQYYPTIPIVTTDGIYGEETVAAVDEFKRLFGIPSESNRVSVQIWDAITDVYDDLYNGGSVNDGQYPGYNLGE